MVTDESFVPKVDAVSFLKARASYGLLKARASYGLLGSNNIGNYSQYANVATNVNTIFGATVPSLSNPNLGWEKTRQFDVGLDLGLFQNRITLNYEYYVENTTDLLYSVTMLQESVF